MDNELKELGALALRNAFWQTFSDLVHDTLRASEGLVPADDQHRMLGELTSAYGIAPAKLNPTDLLPKIVTFDRRGKVLKRHVRMKTALEQAEAATIMVDSRTIFVRAEGEGEWMWRG